MKTSAIPRGGQMAPAVIVSTGSDASTLIAVPRSGVDLQVLERALIIFALDVAGGNRTRAARLLRLTRSALLYRMHKYGLATITDARMLAGTDEKCRDMRTSQTGLVQQGSQ